MMNSSSSSDPANFRNTVLSSPLFFIGDTSSNKGQDPDTHHDGGTAAVVSTTTAMSYIFSCIHALLTLFFTALIVYTLVAVKHNTTSEVFTECAQDLWTLLLLHITVPFAFGLMVLILGLCVSGPTLLYCTNQNTFLVTCLPTLLLMAYSSTMLILGVRFTTERSDHCNAALIEPTKALSPQVPLLTVLLWVFVAIDSILLLLGTTFLTFIICIQINATARQSRHQEEDLSQMTIMAQM